MNEHAYRQMVADLARDGHEESRPKREIREEIVTNVNLAVEAGEPWAEVTLARWAREGAERDYERAHNALNTTTYVRADGTRRRKTTSYSTPKRNTDSGDVEGYVQRSFWDYPLATFRAKRAEMAIQTDRLADVVAAMDQVLDAWAAHPEAETAREAWEAAGHATTEIDLAEAVA